MKGLGSSVKDVGNSSPLDFYQLETKIERKIYLSTSERQKKLLYFGKISNTFPQLVENLAEDFGVNAP